MSGLTWAQIRRYYLEATGETTAAVQEAYDHLSAGYRRVASLPAVQDNTPELGQTLEQSIDEAVDYFELDASVYSITAVFNLTSSVATHPEPNGVLGRTRYLRDNAMPAIGVIRWYYRDGNRVYVRDRQTATLQLKYKLEVPNVTEADLDDHPLTPDHFDWAIIHAAAANYFSIHKDPGTAQAAEGQPPMPTPQERAEASYASSVGEPKPVLPSENMGVYHKMRLAGYRTTVRGRRW